MAAERIMSYKKGKLLYQTPEKNLSIRFLALVFHLVLVIISLILNLLLIVLVLGGHHSHHHRRDGTRPPT